MAHPSFTFQRSVLFIDDQTRFENLIRGGLLSFPAQYEFCPSRVSTTLERLEKETPDLMVVTLDFSEGSVLELVEKTRGFIETVPAIYLSEPHLADIEAEMALRGRFQVMKRSPDPLALIRKMSQMIMEAESRPKTRLRRRGSSSGGAHGSGSPIMAPDWAGSILKKNR
jgi:hypothetical protein